jgi:hypothetical protein
MLLTPFLRFSCFETVRPCGREPILREYRTDLRLQTVCCLVNAGGLPAQREGLNIMLAYFRYSDKFAFFWQTFGPRDGDQIAHMRRKGETSVDATMLKFNLPKSHWIEPSKEGPGINHEAGEYQVDNRKITKIDTSR